MEPAVGSGGALMTLIGTTAIALLWAFPQALLFVAAVSAHWTHDDSLAREIGDTSPFPAPSP